MLMDYLHTNHDAVIPYHSSDMIFKIVLDTAFLVLTQVQSQATANYNLR